MQRLLDQVSCIQLVSPADDEVMIYNGMSEDSDAIYYPKTGEWKRMDTVGSPDRRLNPEIVWTGESMIIWGGSDGHLFEFYDGGVFTPSGSQ